MDGTQRGSLSLSALCCCALRSMGGKAPADRAHVSRLCLLGEAPDPSTCPVRTQAPAPTGGAECDEGNRADGCAVAEGARAAEAEGVRVETS